MDNRRLLMFVAATLIAVGAGTARLAAGTPSLAAVPKDASRSPVEQVDAGRTRALRATTWRWQTVIGLRRSHFWSPLDTRRALRFWQRQARHMRRLAARPRHKSGWLCIHRYEGSWSDGGDPYWGGLQMDRGFMLRYAPRLLLRRGFANRWTPLEQMWVAERAYRSGRGFYAWPSTAHACGLL